MDILSIIGYVLAFALVIVSIMMGTDPDTGKTTLIVNQLKGFIDYGSLAIVVGGTIGAMLISYPASIF